MASREASKKDMRDCKILTIVVLMSVVIFITFHYFPQATAFCGKDLADFLHIGSAILAIFLGWFMLPVWEYVLLGDDFDPGIWP